MIAKYNRWSLMFGVPGIVLQIAGFFLSYIEDGLATMLGEPSLAFGTLLLLISLALYAKAKGQSPVWCVAGFLSIPGLIVLALLEDKSGSTRVAGEEHEKA